MVHNIRQFWQFAKTFGMHNKLEMAVLAVGGFLMGLLELMGLTAILPLMLLVVQPDTALENSGVRFFYNILQVDNLKDLGVYLGLFAASVFIGKSLLQALYWRYEYKVLAKWRIGITDILYKAYMSANYEDFMQNNTSHMINILNKIVPIVLNSFVHPMLNLANYALTGIIILFYIIYIDWIFCVLVIVFGTVLIVAYTAGFKKITHTLGNNISDLSYMQYGVLQQSFAGYKETRTHLKEDFFADRFYKIANELAYTEGRLRFLQALPSITVELFVMFLLILMFEIMVYSVGNIQIASATIGAIVLACVRMIPILNRSIIATVTINSSKGPLDDLLEEAKSFEINNIDPDKIGASAQKNHDIQALPFNEELRVEDISYSYPGTDNITLKNISLSIKPGEFIGITGPSGGGKSTLINIILGFLTRYSGTYTVDGAPITVKNIKNMRQIVGFVDQHIFLMEGSIAENVAFGIDKGSIDREKVALSLEKAQMLKYVTTLPEGIDTPVGENGKTLSGGQRQRIAIARALYRDLKILILDEASASLDVETEYKLFTFLETLKGELTVIMIAHRLSTLRCSDRVLFINNGHVEAQGTFNELHETHETFRRYLEYSQLKKDEPA